jgi:pimeloyl-ACP methyl ester carboxylesterase
MKKRTGLVIATALVGGLILQRKLALREDLDWHDVEKPGEIAEIDGYGVHYVELGHGPVMMLVHGFGASTYSYRHLMPIFARDHRVIAVDLKGFGYSERDSGAGLSATDQVAMLKKLLDRNAVDRAVFIGHSMGGGVVRRFAATYPAMTEAIVLAASIAGEERIARAALPPTWLLKPVLPVLANLTASRLLKMMYYDRSKISDDVRDGYMRPVRLKGSMDGLLAMMRDRADDPPIDDAKITMPVLLLNGAADQVIPLSAAQRIREHIPHARLVVIEGAAHGLLEERPEDCARAISDFLRDSGVGVAAPAASS